MTQATTTQKGWETVTIGEISEVIGGGTPSSKVDEYWGGSIPWLTPKDLSGYDFRRVKSGKRNITDSGLANSSARLLPKNTVLVTSRAPIGYVALADNEMATNQGFKSLILNDGYEPDFFYYLIKHNVPTLEAVSSGTTFKEISGKAFKQIKFNVPPLPEQKAIAHILGSLDDKIELNRRMNETLEAMAQALFKSWFVDFDPVIDNALAARNAIPDELKERAAIRQGLDDERKSLPDDIRRFFPSEFAYTEEMGWIPKGWEIGPLRLIATYCSDRIPTSELMLENYVSTENMLAEKKGICKAAKLPTVKTALSYQSGNVLVSNIRPYFKKIWFAEGSGGCSNDILNFTVKELNTEEYLLNLLWQDTFFDYMMTTAKGSKMPRGDKDAIMNWKVIIPPVESRRLFAETVSGFYKQILGKYKINTVLTQFRDKLLTRLLSGEIRITGSGKSEGGLCQIQ